MSVHSSLAETLTGFVWTSQSFKLISSADRLMPDLLNSSANQTLVELLLSANQQSESSEERSSKRTRFRSREQS